MQMDHKGLLRSILCLTLAFSFYCTTIYPQDTSITFENSLSKDILFDKENPLQLSCEAAVLMDARTGVVLYEKNKDERLYPASITKIMTVLLVLESGLVAEEPITHSHEAIFGIGPGSSHIGMREGETISLEDALLGIMLASANEVCVAVAERLGGTKEAFAAQMTERAKALGANDTSFTNPHGFHDENHYTTAYDMALITKEAVRHDKFKQLIATRTHTIAPTNIVNESRVINNSNRLIQPGHTFYYPTCVGGKTGFTDEAGHTLVSYAERDGNALIAVVLKGEPQAPYQDTVKLFDYGFDTFETHRLFNAADYTSQINVVQHYGDRTISLGTARIIAEKNFTITVPYFITNQTVKKTVTLPEQIEPPLSYGTVVGRIDITYDGVLLGTVNLISADVFAKVDEAVFAREMRMEHLRARFLPIVGAALMILVFALILLFRILAKTGVLQAIKNRPGIALTLPKRLYKRKKDGKTSETNETPETPAEDE